LNGNVRVLLMTSRDTGRWIIPKGNIGAGETADQAAAKEAYEEAGIKGTIAHMIGTYAYVKKLAAEEDRDAEVDVYLLRVTKQLKKWPEKRERKLSWLSIEKAVRLVEEPGVIPLLRRLTEIEQELAGPRHSLSFEPQSGESA
jgi:8-oxo-dGTP pyrophosphatase MutT (NUDIX family)